MKLARGSCAATTSSRCSSSLGARTLVALPARRSAGARRAACSTRVQASQQTVKASTSADEKRWDAQVVDGKVRYVQAEDIKGMLADGWVLLDVRPPGEASKARIVGAIEAPLFVEDTSSDLASFVKRASAFGMGGWWLGGTHMMPNPNFMAEVEAKVPKDAKVLVGCQKGLRSLAACEQLSLGGYKTLAWVNGGFDTCKAGQVPTEGNIDIRYSGIGGLSEVLGWTEVQQDENKNMGSAMSVLKVVALILVADLLLFAYEYLNGWFAPNS